LAFGFHNNKKGGRIKIFGIREFMKRGKRQKYSTRRVQSPAFLVHSKWNEPKKSTVTRGSSGKKKKAEYVDR
jgi:hypothetical protein